ncbi:MAG: GNAT family N-acetyltransferase [Clostridiales bacterium]|nr:GNAT family N-acetyltransferase [Clostridiales bacterium]
MEDIIKEDYQIEIVKAQACHIDGITNLLYEVQSVHAEKRPDIFVSGGKKYTKSELENIIINKNTPIYVATNKQNAVLGYIFCQIQSEVSKNLQPIKTLYIDDLCVDKNARFKGIGKALFGFAKEIAKGLGCYHITLNVWHLNESALKFYQKLGLIPLKTTMEEIL